MATKSKATTAIAAGVLSAALLLGGTFAWTSLGQRVKNETIVDVNPGGRLHDDFNGITGDKNVYVENFSEDPDGVPIYARIRLDEYMESGPDAGINRFPEEGQTRNVDVIRGTDINNVDTWVTFKPTAELIADDAGKLLIEANADWKWKLGHDLTAEGDVIYMPTFNKNKDSLAADINGTYEGVTPGDAAHYDDYTPWAEGQSRTKDAVYDHDSNAEEEFSPESGKSPAWISTTDDMTPEDAANVLLKTETHKAQVISSSSHVITMSQWQELLNNDVEGDETGAFWVWDEEDGWAYWAEAIQPGETTGLFLDGIQMYHVPDENWYYGINVVSQFVTSGDGGAFIEGSLSEGAKALMGELGVSLTVTDPSEPEPEETEGPLYFEIYADDAWMNEEEAADAAFFLEYNQPYDLVILYDEAEDVELLDAKPTIELRIKDKSGTDVTANFTSGEDYTLTQPSADFADGEGLAVEGFKASTDATLKITDPALYDCWIELTAILPENNMKLSKTYLVCDEQADFDIVLYDAETGEQVKNTLAENKTYDVAVLMGETVVYTTNENHSGPVAAGIGTSIRDGRPMITVDWTSESSDEIASAGVTVNGNNQIVTTTKPEGVEHLEIRIDTGIEQVKSSDTHYYVNSISKPTYYKGDLPLSLAFNHIRAHEIENDADEAETLIILAEDDSFPVSVSFSIYDSITFDDESQVDLSPDIQSYTLNGNESQNTEIKMVGEYIYALSIPEDETADILEVTVTLKDGSTVSKKVKLEYLTIQADDAGITETNEENIPQITLVKSGKNSATIKAKEDVAVSWSWDADAVLASGVRVADNEGALTVNCADATEDVEFDIFAALDGYTLVSGGMYDDNNMLKIHVVCKMEEGGGGSEGDYLVAELFSSSEGEYGSSEVPAGTTLYIIARLHDAETVVDCEWRVEPEGELGDAEVTYQSEKISCKTFTVPENAQANDIYQIFYTSGDYSGSITIKVTE